MRPGNVCQSDKSIGHERTRKGKSCWLTFLSQWRGVLHLLQRRGKWLIIDPHQTQVCFSLLWLVLMFRCLTNMTNLVFLKSSGHLWWGFIKETCWWCNVNALIHVASNVACSSDQEVYLQSELKWQCRAQNGLHLAAGPAVAPEHGGALVPVSSACNIFGSSGSSPSSSLSMWIKCIWSEIHLCCCLLYHWSDYIMLDQSRRSVFLTQLRYCKTGLFVSCKKSPRAQNAL